MTKTELLEAIIQKQDELIKKYAEYSRFLLRHGISNCGAWIIMKDQLDNDLNEMLFELSELKKQLEECKEKDRTCDNCNWFKIGYGHCVWCLRNAPYNKKLSEKTSGYSDKWEPIKTE